MYKFLARQVPTFDNRVAQVKQTEKKSQARNTEWKYYLMDNKKNAYMQIKSSKARKLFVNSSENMVIQIPCLRKKVGIISHVFKERQ
jgi:hypothetical protein